MGCCKDKCTNDQCYCPSEEIMRGLKAKLMYETCDLKCTPADRCACEQVLDDIKLANEWISSLPGMESSCDG